MWDSVRGYTTFPYTKYAYERAQNGQYTSIYGDKLEKIYKFQKDDPTLFESDVPETTRALVDLYGDSDDPDGDVRVMTLDIEVEMESGLPDTKIATNELTAIGFHDSVLNEYYVLVVDKENKVQQTQTEKCLVLPYSTEEDMIDGFLSMYEQRMPDIITGWNIDFFDIPYLFNRIKNVKGETHANRLSPIGKSFYSPYRQKFFLAGVSCLDYITLYKNYNFGELPNYRLDTVARIELGKGKIEYDGNLDDLFRTDIEKYVEYNLVDVELVVEMDRKLQFIDLCRGICHSGHVPYEDFVFSSKYLEGAMLTYLRRRNLVAPNKSADRRALMDEMKEAGAEKFIGAYVKDPIVGKYDWVYDLDLTSLYPSIIMTLNISPETKIGKVSDWDGATSSSNGLGVYDYDGQQISYDNLVRYLTDNNLSISSNGVIYDLDNVGCIPGILDLWFDKRVEYNKLKKQYGLSGDKDKYAFYHKRQLVQKILLNSLYGVLGLPAFRFYDVDNAEAVTTTGQTVIKSTADMVNAKYNKEIYSDQRIELIGDDGSTHVLNLTEYVTVERNNQEIIIQAKDLVEGDNILTLT